MTILKAPIQTVPVVDGDLVSLDRHAHRFRKAVDGKITLEPLSGGKPMAVSADQIAVWMAVSRLKLIARPGSRSMRSPYYRRRERRNPYTRMSRAIFGTPCAIGSGAHMQTIDNRFTLDDVIDDITRDFLDTLSDDLRG